MNREQYRQFDAVMRRYQMKEFCLHPLVEGDGYSLTLDSDSVAVLVHDVCGHPVSHARLNGISLAPVKVSVSFDQGECDRGVEENRSSDDPCCITADCEVKSE